MSEENNNLFESKSILNITASLLIGIIIGCVFTIKFDGSFPDSISNFKKGYSAGFDGAKKLVENSPLGDFIKSPITDPHTISGIVTSVSGDIINVHISNVENPFEGVGLNDRIIHLDSSTKIVKFTQKDKASLENSLSGTATTDFYNSTNINISDIKVDDIISVSSLNQINVAKEFTANTVYVFPKMFAK